ncbi:hemopexin isoform X2 [Bufo bufo]|uniref:hemopexin isoform X2 n=1 Tax=Bufo bufo TaxID=8384 RepID=UPI001ABDE290|nr:hemopexin isoform X2 [Bufo bufo]
MRDCAIPCALLCLLPLVLPYPLIKGRHNDTGTNLHSAPDPAYSLPGTADRCSGEGFGAITLDDKGVMHYFRGDSVWMGFQGPTQHLNKTFPGMTGPVDAAFRNHNENRALEHQRTYLFKGSLVWSYFEGQLVMGYPRLISQEFPGVPDNLDAAVECHRGECRTDSILFFKGHGHAARQNATLMSIKDRCSNRSFEAFSSDDKSWTYAYRGGWFFRLDTSKDGWHAWPLSHTWKNLQGTVDAVFNHENRMYFIQGSQVIVYISDQMYIPVLGYPKPIQEEWEVSGVTAVDAAFTCPHSSDLYLLRGNKLILVDLNMRKRSGEDRTIIHADVDSAMCNTHGLYLFHGQTFYHYKNVEELLSSKVAPAPGNIASYFLDC